MKTELEVRFLEINVKGIEDKLNALGAKEIGNWKQKRNTYDLIPKKENSWLRLRINEEKTTLTVKEILTDKIDGTKELEIEVNDFDETALILRKIGLQERNYQENKRHQFLLNGVEIDIDFWPLIPPYLEIEGESEEEIKKVASLLELDYSKAITMDVTDIYNKIYDIDILNIKLLKF